MSRAWYTPWARKSPAKRSGSDLAGNTNLNCSCRLGMKNQAGRQRMEWVVGNMKAYVIILLGIGSIANWYWNYKDYSYLPAERAHQLNNYIQLYGGILFICVGLLVLGFRYLRSQGQATGAAGVTEHPGVGPQDESCPDFSRFLPAKA
jgi:hypothetical protein